MALIKFGEGPGPAPRNRPIAGPLPDLNTAWTYYDKENPDTVKFTPEEMRELTRDMQNLGLNGYNLHQLTLAMNAVADLGQPGVNSIMDDVILYHDLQNRLEALEGSGSLDGLELSPDGLPMIKADVVEWSDKALGCCGKGDSYFQKVLAPFKEAQARLVMKVCIALNLCDYELRAVCCSHFQRMDSYFSTTPLYRS
jgi:hypothetical protein